jgi:2-keto-3-deoxy-L-rhamnonate aldolase RhmA
MAANVAVGASDPVGRVVAGWPAVSLLLAIKLLSGLIDHHTESTQPAARSAAVSPPAGERSVASGADRTRRRVRVAGTVRGTDDGSLLVAAVSVRDAVAADGAKLTRGVLADRLRRQGVPVSNARLTWLLKELGARSSPAVVAAAGRRA